MYISINVSYFSPFLVKKLFRTKSRKINIIYEILIINVYLSRNFIEKKNITDFLNLLMIMTFRLLHVKAFSD